MKHLIHTRFQPGDLNYDFGVPNRFNGFLFAGWKVNR
jgi:hypothetical protein